MLFSSDEENQTVMAADWESIDLDSIWIKYIFYEEQRQEDKWLETALVFYCTASEQGLQT